MDGWWSCDMALGRDGIWYLIDMAPGAASIPLAVVRTRIGFLLQSRVMARDHT